MVNYYRCISYERQLILIFRLIFRYCSGLRWSCSGKRERDKHTKGPGSLLSSECLSF